MKKKAKQLLVAAFFGVILLTSTITIAMIGSTPSETNDTTTTGTPADNYPDDQRATYCGTGAAKSSRYITEFKVSTVCAQPLAITTDPSGNVWFTESNTGKLAKFDPFSRFFIEFENAKWPKGDQSMMWGIDYASDGNIWYTDEAHDVIWKFSTADSNYSSFKYPVSTGGKSFPQKIVIEGDKILVNDFDGNKITFFDYTQGGQEINYSTVNLPTRDTVTAAIAIDSNKKIWFTVWNFQTGEGNLIRYDPQTSNGTRFNFPLGMRAPNGISVDKQDKIWLSDTSSSFFFSFDPQSQHFTKYITSPPQEVTYGNSSGLIKTPVTRPYWNSFDEKGRLWFNEQTGNSIAVFDPAKESLVEYLVPSQNSNWADCGDLEGCGIAQVLDFTINGDKIWFTEWAENNIGVLDSGIPLPIEVNLEPNEIILNKGETSTLSFTITPNEQLDGMVTLTTAHTATLNDVIVIGADKKITVKDQPEIVSLSISADKFALSGTYKLLVGAQYKEVTISQFITITVK